MTLSLRQRWQNAQKTDFNFVVITRLSTAANSNPSKGQYIEYSPSLFFEPSVVFTLF